MFKRYALASLVAGLALAAQSAVAGNLWFYEGNGWLAQPPFSSARDDRSASVIAGPTSAIAGSQPSQSAMSQTSTSIGAFVPAPYDMGGGYFN